jgi:hypothetical protein
MRAFPTKAQHRFPKGRAPRREAPGVTLRDDAPLRSSFVRVCGDCLASDEVPIALDGKAEFAADGLQFDEAHIAELLLAHAKVAEAEGETAVGIEFRQEPGALRVGGEEFGDGFEVDCSFVFVDGGALGAAVGEEFFGESFGDEFHLVWFLSLEDPIGPFEERQGPMGSDLGTKQIISQEPCYQGKKQQP